MPPLVCPLAVFLYTTASPLLQSPHLSPCVCVCACVWPQDAVHKALSAEVDGTAVGLIALGGKVDIALLDRCFELAPCVPLPASADAMPFCVARSLHCATCPVSCLPCVRG